MRIQQSEFKRPIVEDLGFIRVGKKLPRKLKLGCDTCDRVDEVSVFHHNIHVIQNRTCCSICKRKETESEYVNNSACLQCNTPLTGKLKKTKFCSDKCKWDNKAENRPDEEAMYYGSKTRANKRNLEFNIEISDIHIPTHCSVLGIPLYKALGQSAGKDNSPSLDRIDSNLGYVKGNIRVISHRANTLKSNATLKELRLVLSDLERTELGQ